MITEYMEIAEQNIKACCSGLTEKEVVKVLLGIIEEIVCNHDQKERE